MLFRSYTDSNLAQNAYLIGCQKTKEALIIDPLRDIDQYIAQAEAEGLRIVAVAETHIHADFLSGAREFAEQTGAHLYLSAEGEDDGWGSAWAKGSDYDVTFLRDGDQFSVGNIDLKAVHTPGHTPEHLSYVVTDRGSGATTPIGVVTGDFVFVGDLGRPDLLEQAAGMHGVQEDAARTLFHSLPRFTQLEEHLQVWPGHGAGSACGKALGAVPMTTVGYEKRYNASLGAAEGGEDAFVSAILDGQPEPQMYFARMKQQNRDGVPLLGQVPNPSRLPSDELSAFSKDEDGVVIDTRTDRSAFMASHVPRSLHAPLGKNLPAFVGSLLTDETTPIVLVVEKDQVDGAVRDLVRIGYDAIVGFVTPADLADYFADGGVSASIPERTFDDLDQLQAETGGSVLDVRYASEHQGGHVPGAVNASYTRLPDYMDSSVPDHGPLIVHCQSGVRAAAASAYLARQGRDVIYINDGFPSFAATGRAITQD